VHNKVGDEVSRSGTTVVNFEAHKPEDVSEYVFKQLFEKLI
jgi:hypothetical protein